MLAWTIYITFFGVLVLMLLPRDNARAARIVALLTAIAGCVVAFVGAIQQANPGDVLYRDHGGGENLRDS